MCVSMLVRRMGQKSSLQMVDPASWSTRAVQLHIACGKSIVLSEEGSVAQRKDALRQPKDGLVHTAWPIAVGRLFQVNIHALTDSHVHPMTEYITLIVSYTVP